MSCKYYTQKNLIKLKLCLIKRPEVNIFVAIFLSAFRCTILFSGVLQKVFMMYDVDIRFEMTLFAVTPTKCRT